MKEKDPDELEWDLAERDQFMQEFGQRTDVEPEIEILVNSNE